VVEVPGREGLVVLTGGEPETTNNRMELIGAIEGLKEVRRLIERGEVPAETPIHLYSDSSYLVKGVEEWLEGWERKGFKKVKNRELWEELARLKKGLNLRLHWVKGHDGVERNEKCDLVAREMAQFFKNNR
jgi:ribonuclease HI